MLSVWAAWLKIIEMSALLRPKNNDDSGIKYKLSI